MLSGQKPALFVIVGHIPDGDFTVPIVSARAAAQVVRHLTEYCPQTRATWQVHPHAVPSPGVVFGCARPSIGEYLPDQNVHVFLLAAGEPLPPVWVAVCGRQVVGAGSRPLIRAWADPAETATSAGPRRSISTPVCPFAYPASTCIRLVSSPVPGPPMISPEAAARALCELFLTNADRGDNIANDHLIADMVGASAPSRNSVTAIVASNRRPSLRLAPPQLVAMAAMADRLDTIPITWTPPRRTPASHRSLGYVP